MLIKHISNNDKTFMIVDCDLDGYVSAALFLNYLNNLFPYWVQNCVFYINHQGKQHGLSDIDLQKIVNDNFKFVVCLDSSSNDYSEHEFLKSNNIDVLVIDHHNAEKVSEYACVINNQLCNYPTKSLCGGAMTYKFCCYLDLLIKTSYAINYEDLAAISLKGDMMELKDFETHYLVKDGIQRIRNPFFQEKRPRRQQSCRPSQPSSLSQLSF